MTPPVVSARRLAETTGGISAGQRATPKLTIAAGTGSGTRPGARELRRRRPHARRSLPTTAGDGDSLDSADVDERARASLLASREPIAAG
jgi:hypothetical protein